MQCAHISLFRVGELQMVRVLRAEKFGYEQSRECCVLADLGALDDTLLRPKNTVR